MHSKYELIESNSVFWLVERNELFIEYVRRIIWNRDIARNYVQKFNLLSEI